MIYTRKIEEAIILAIKTHEIDEKQKRKGKDIPYITHPLTVGLILSLAGANEDVVIAGILHDTIEDSIENNKVTKEMIAEHFGDNVMQLVQSVTEQDKSLSWEQRKAEALEHIKTFSHDSLLLKSADLISNTREIIADYEKDGDDMFSKFNASKEKILGAYIDAMNMILNVWREVPTAEDLKEILIKLEEILNKKSFKEVMELLKSKQQESTKDYGQTTINALKRSDLD
jgi:(p)ppGpp synthase/HD superfamily hydrolase